MRQRWKELDFDGKHPLFEPFNQACEHFFGRYESFRIRQEEHDKSIKKLQEWCLEVEALIGQSNDESGNRLTEIKSLWAEVFANNWQW